MCTEHTEHRKQQGLVLAAGIFSPFPLARGAKEDFGYQQCPTEDGFQ